jgi:hypothetical protein
MMPLLLLLPAAAAGGLLDVAFDERGASSATT